MPITPPPADGLSRRELNRQATAQAIAQAALTLAEADDWAAVTVERVAEEAGISRRTFFNYYSSLEEALNRPLQVLMQTAANRMATDHDPADLDILDRLLEGITEVLSLDLMEPAARVLLMGRDNAALHAAQLITWERCVQTLMPPEEGTPAVRLYTSTLIRAAIGAAQAAFDAWGTHLVRPLSESDVERLRSTIADAIGLLRDGFARPSWLTEEDLASCNFSAPTFII
ncbi:TetR/AcrR family transcriptional regulator [Galactobacter caseinivorans]|uniref:TetR family transcriptional regulator n=1 Tax=Galactobacter caseinivorans TaxID=2676123 RepID=A0A496PHW5_9MICC|nr:TetR/AcrR family transcriptional regulator [Galactobacter caseinivorans]RKW70077.1 TetR family transcriptional regulator [Galactobacter caseinivorans]